MELHPFIIEHGLDIFTTVLGLLYIWLEYRAHIALWIVGIIMPALDIYLYYSHGLYGDAGMAGYYTVAAIYASGGHPNDNRYYQIGYVPSAGFTAMGSITLKF